MGSSVGGACIGFLAVLVGGIAIVYGILNSGSLDSDPAIGVLGLSIVVIPVLAIFGAIFGAIIGHFASGTSSKT
ncbi:MAG: hypothetical protein ACTSO6_09295 [Promethearchaeota archaeon]